jgi:hypothetical protein
MTSPLKRAICTHCRQEVLWGRLQNGRMRSFEPKPVLTSSVSPADAYAYSKTLRAWVDLVGALRPPVQVLVAHYCQEYRDEKVLGRCKPLGYLLVEDDDSAEGHAHLAAATRPGSAG